MPVTISSSSGSRKAAVSYVTLVRPTRPDAYEALDEIVESRRCVVLDLQGAHDELAALDPERAEVAVVLRARMVEVR